ncbi:MAG: amino acid ABC transporter ATP-binding protein [Clostridia bacterium]|nr:amino acid ABC transporter ATP-binding protein [Clostridia bacterium]
MIKLINVCKRFGNLEVLKGVSLDIKKGEIISVIGPSGTGKSTLLRCINLLEKPDSGIIQMDDISVDAANVSKSDVISLRKNTGMVFQNFNLFRNKTVTENITEGLIAVKKMDKKEAEDVAIRILEQVGLTDKKDQYPYALSGGQQQRVAIGRAMAMNPKILLFDEPTSALDPELVNEVLELIKKLALEHMTMIIVTHEINFARNVSDKICFMSDGMILESGKPCDVIDNPVHERTRQFLNFIR